MTKEELREMAREAGGIDVTNTRINNITVWLGTGTFEFLDAFARLIAEKATKEALAQPGQEPVAIRYDFDGYGYQYIDSGSGSDWQKRVQGEPLYTAPQPEQEPVAWVYPEGLEALKAGKPWTAYGTRQEPNNTALYLSPQPDIAPYAWVTFTPYGDEDDVWYENPEGQLLEGWTYKPLYDTTPPQRPWVGLSREDCYQVRERESDAFMYGVAWAEAKLKEKNT